VDMFPLMGSIGLFIHAFAFFAVSVVLWVMGPLGDTKDIWTKFEDPRGWGSNVHPV
jgi:hypothetical protein